MTAITLPAATHDRLREHGEALWIVLVENGLLDHPGSLRWMDGNDEPEVYGAGGVWLSLPRPYTPDDVLTVEGLGTVRVAEVRTPVRVGEIETHIARAAGFDGEETLHPGSFAALAAWWQREHPDLPLDSWVWPVLLKLERKTDDTI